MRQQCFFKPFSSYFTIALLGRPNVGKSTLFNSLNEKQRALVDPGAGMTRDYKIVKSNLLGFPIQIIDTAGYQMEKSILNEKTIQQTEKALKMADLALFLIDAKHGVTRQDMQIASFLRQRAKQIILVANKWEDDLLEPDLDQIEKLGFGEAIRVSAEHGEGILDLLELLKTKIPREYQQEQYTRILKRINRYQEIKTCLKEEILELGKEVIFIKKGNKIHIEEWERTYDLFQINPEENSDLDSDGELNFLKEKMRIIPGSKNYQCKKPIHLSIVGRPNVGKSSILNAFLSDQRVVTHDLPGTTRDSINVDWEYKNRKIILIDTAGINKKMHQTVIIQYQSPIEKKTQLQTFQTINRSHVVICVIDALSSFRSGDLELAQKVVKEGRSLVLVINKWDLMHKDWQQKALKYMRKQLDRSLGDLKDVPLLPVSAHSGYQVSNLMEQVINLYDKWNQRISTGILNDWLSKFKKLHNLPQHNGNQLSIQFISQIKSRPPTFALFVNNLTLFDQDYMRFMQSKLTQEFDFQGVPIRLVIRDENSAKTKSKDKYSQHKIIKNIIKKQRKQAEFAKKSFEKQML